jgi:hypothetical protein
LDGSVDIDQRLAAAFGQFQQGLSRVNAAADTELDKLSDINSSAPSLGASNPPLALANPNGQLSLS